MAQVQGSEDLIPVAVILALLTGLLFLFRVLPWRKRGSWRWIWVLATVASLMIIVAEGTALTFEHVDAAGASFQVPLFVAVLAGAAGFFVVYTDALRAAESSRLLSLTDALTGLPNSRAFQERLRLSFDARAKAPFTVMYLDLDGFKKVNDQLGHEAGDLVLKRSSSILASAVRTVDMVARVGGDEFAFVLQHSQPSSAQVVADRALRGLHALEIPGGLQVSGSFGCAFSKDAKDPDDLVAQADAAMYTAKRAGGGRVGASGALLVQEAQLAV